MEIIEIFLGFTTIVLLVFLVIGLINPSIILRWNKKPTRVKVFIYWLLLNSIVVIIMSILFSNQSPEQRYQSAKNNIHSGNYEIAISELNKIKNTDTLFAEAQILIHQADSLLKIQQAEETLKREIEEKQDSIKNQNKEEAKKKALLEEERERPIDTLILELRAKSLMKKAIKLQLKAPSTAKFPSSTLRYWFLPDSTVVIKGCVDAQNSFGAMLRSSFYFKAKWFSGYENLERWIVIKAQLEE